MITRLGINAGDLILEIGEDSDCDQELRKEIFATSGNQPVGDDDGETVQKIKFVLLSVYLYLIAF